MGADTRNRALVEDDDLVRVEHCAHALRNHEHGGAVHLVLEREPNEGPLHLETPFICNLTRDPKEETDVGTEASWVRTPLRRMIHAFQQSLKQNPPIPPGAPDDYVPKSNS